MPAREPPRINQLSEAIANQIAAGEVVERPAAVVKELAENSLDAGATRIVVTSEDGGRRLIEIADDGCGMRPDDLRLALSRHATSKITDADDLFRIGTLGFRGEALPSIAAVSEFTLASRPHAAAAGHEIVLAGGREVRSGVCAMPPGTRVSVRNLFWNVPARLKFLKSEAAETGHITDQVTRLALSHPRVAFRLDCDGRTVLDLPGVEDLSARVASLFEPDLAAALIPLSGSSGAMQLSGFVAHPRTARPTSKRQYLFLNGRYVRDRILIAAVKEGCKGFLEPRLHLALFLHLDVEPSQVDVNVHPTKSEVRFRQEGQVFALVQRTLHEALTAHQGGFALLPNDVVRREVVKPAPPQVIVQERFLPEHWPADPGHGAGSDAGAGSGQRAAGTAAIATRAAEALAAYQVAPRPTPATAANPASASNPGGGELPLADRTAAPTSPASSVIPARSSNPGGGELPLAGTTNALPAFPAPGPTAPALPPGFRRVLQLNRMFLLIETERGIRLVDQHALHEKALFLALDPNTGDLLAGGTQELLVPLTVPLPAAEAALVEPLLPDLAACGIRATRSASGQIQVHAHPARLRRLDWAGFFADLAEDGAKAVDRIRERIAHRAACRAAVKAGQDLSPAEQLELVRLLHTMDGLEHCPHGRPTTLDLSWAELATRFQR